MRQQVANFLADYMAACAAGNSDDTAMKVIMDRHGFMGFTELEKLAVIEAHRRQCPNHQGEEPDPGR